MTVLFGNSKGGVGKSTLAVNLAVHQASEGLDVAIVDTDRQGSVAAWSAVRDEEGITPRIPCVQVFGRSTANLKILGNATAF